MRINRVHLLALLVLAVVSPVAMGQDDVNGLYGHVIVDGEGAAPLNTSGVILRSEASRPSVSLTTGATGTTSGFIVFHSANIELLRVRSDGNVGIGASTPRAALHILRSVAGLGPELLLENNQPWILDAAAITVASSGVARAQIYSGLDVNSAEGYLDFKTGGVPGLTTRMSILPSGVVEVPGILRSKGSSGFTAEFRDITAFGNVNGVRLTMQGNSEIYLAGMRFGKNSNPIIESDLPLQLNPFTHADVVAGGNVRI